MASKASSLACIREMFAILEVSSGPKEKPHTLAKVSRGLRRGGGGSGLEVDIP